VRFALLGPLSVHEDDGTPLKVTGALRRTLLAALLLDAGTPVSADRLAELLWGEKVTGVAYAPLHAQMTRLRQALGDEERVLAAAPGYLIQVEPGELDLQVFAEQCAAGRRRLAARAWGEAARHFGAALELWQGHPLADIPALAGDLRIRELEETRVQALQGRIEAELNLGRHHELLEELHALAGEHPRHEAFHSQLMLALFRAGRPEDAAARYDEYQESLLDEFGLEPGAELRELHAAVLRRDPALALPPDPNAPHQLPADTRTFTGRTAELAELVSAAAQVSGTLVISALDGLGGIGKTALAVHAAHRVADRFPDGQLFIDLRGSSPGTEPMSPGDALAYLLRSLGVPGSSVPEAVPERAALYRERLAERRALIVLDNAADPEQVRPLLPADPGCLVLITSRNRLAGLDRARSLTLDILGEPEAVALLIKVAGPGRGLTDSPALRELAALCGRVPLALRIVASRLRHGSTLTVEALLAELGDEHVRIDRLTDGERDLTSVFDFSFGRLTAPEQRALRLIGLLPGPDLDAYAAANLLDTDTETAERLLGSLLNRSLLIQQVEGRYGMHDLVRAYARTLLDTGSAEAGAARDRLLDYYQQTGWATGSWHTTAIRWRSSPAGFAGPWPRPGDVAEAGGWLRAERANLLDALADPAVATERRLDLALAIAPLLQIDGPWSDAIALQESAERDALALGDVQSQADALRNLGQLTLLTGGGGYPRSKTIFERAVELYRSVGCRAGEADALFRVGRVLTHMDEFAASLPPERESLRIFQEIGDRHGQAHALQSISNSLRMAGDVPGAVEFSQEAVLILRELGNRQAEAQALQNLGYAQFELGELHAALETFDRALEINREYAQPLGVGAALDVVGWIHSLQGAHELALAAYEESLGLFESLDYDFGAAVVLGNFSQARVAAGDPAGAIEGFERAAELLGSFGTEYGRTETLRKLGWARTRIGDRAAGTALLRETLEAYRGPVDDPPGEIETLLTLGRLSLEDGQVQAALEYFEEALPRARQIKRAVNVAWILDGLARCRELLGERAAALEPLREAVAMYERMGLAELAGARERLGALAGEGEVSQAPAAEVS
jgi:DNA-binding SARP family transcriptional activator/Tfp pilus assembly protein PilF